MVNFSFMAFARFTIFSAEIIAPSVIVYPVLKNESGHREFFSFDFLASEMISHTLSGISLTGHEA